MLAELGAPGALPTQHSSTASQGNTSPLRAVRKWMHLSLTALPTPPPDQRGTDTVSDRTDRRTPPPNLSTQLPSEGPRTEGYVRVEGKRAARDHGVGTEDGLVTALTVGNSSAEGPAVRHLDDLYPGEWCQRGCLTSPLHCLISTLQMLTQPWQFPTQPWRLQTQP